LLAGNQDPRLRTLILHVPTLGATREHVDQTLGLVTGGNATHYWEESGIIGRHYDELLGLDGIYAWDIWFIYKPGVAWTETLPPAPDFTMHQLGRPLLDHGLPFLDSKIFAARANEILSRMPPPVDALVVNEVSAGKLDSAIPVIAQPAAVAIGQHIKGRGGYRNIKQINHVVQSGLVTINGEEFSFTIEQDRDGHYRRVVTTEDGESIAERAHDGAVTFAGPGNGFGLSVELETAILNQFDIDGPIVDWKTKKHRLATLVDMEKIGNTLTWALSEQLAGGQQLRFNIDTHGGHLVKETHLDESDKPKIIIEYHGHHQSENNKLPATFRLDRGPVLENFVVPAGITYRDGAGRILAELHITETTITIAD